MIVIDEDSLDTGDGQVARRAALSLLDGLAPADRVGLAIIPRLKMNFTLTTDRIANQNALAAWVPGGSRETTSLYWIGIAEAFEIEANDPTTRDKVIARECGTGTGRVAASCGRDVIMEARQLAARLHAKGTQTIDALRNLGRALRQIEGPKTMVLVSGGVLRPESMSAFSVLETELAASQVTLYTLFFEKAANNPSRAGLSPTQAEDDRVEEHGLENVTAAAGGTFLRVIGAAEAFFARVATELSASYLLGIEVTPADRNGRPHRVEVKVKRRGLDVHGRKQYVIPADK
jgi:VWFA-related protein